MEKIDLVKSAIKGNEKAFETLVKSESEKLYKTAYLYVRNKEDALDVVQDTIYKAFVSIEKLKQPAYFSTWLTKILIRTAYDLIRKRKKVILDEDILNKFPANSRKDIDAEMDLLTAIAKLDHHYQTSIILFYYHGLPIKTIAEMMGSPESTVKTYLRRAKIELKRLIEGADHFEQRAT